MTSIDKLGGEVRIHSIYHGLARYRSAVELGWYDFVGRFRRSKIGVLWSPIQMGMFVGVIVLLLRKGLGDGEMSYALYVAIGFYAWDFISVSLTEGATHFTAQAGLIKNTPVSLTHITLRKVSFLFFRSLLNAPIPIIAIVFFGGELGFNLLWLLPAPILYACFTYSCLIVFGVIGAYFVDFSHMTQTVARFLFFTTPIIWQGDVGARKLISDYNPFSYFIEIVRAPLSGNVISPTAWLVVIAASFGGLLLAVWVQTAFRTRLIYRL
ncbi:MAG: hypothetical protein AAGD92_01800 [Pseudomonadota bacterium]